MKMINLTPHTIVLQAPNGDRFSIPSSGVARVLQTAGQAFSMLGVPVPCFTAPVFGEVQGLPAPEDDTIFICSLLVCQALKGSRPDVFQPGTGPSDGAVRNEKNQIEAVTRLNQS
jgi:hypothetical protein